MKRKSRENKEIREFILTHVTKRPDDISQLEIEKCGVSRVTVNN